MEGIETLLAKQVETIHRIETFFDLQACKSEIVPELNNLHAKSRESGCALQAAKVSLNHFHNELGTKYAEVIRKMRRNDLLMLDLLEQLDKTDSKKILREHNDNVQQALQGELKTTNSTQSLTVEKMFLSDYQKSPFVAKMKPRCLSFQDFNIHISPQDFEQVPKYMKGRETLDELIEFLHSVIVACFEEKYSLLYKNKKAVTNQQDLALWKVFNQQQVAFPNNKFVTQGDIARKMGRLIDKKVNAKMQMLRHLHILQETRSEGTVYYLWIRE